MCVFDVCDINVAFLKCSYCTSTAAQTRIWDTIIILRENYFDLVKK